MGLTVVFVERLRILACRKQLKRKRNPNKGNKCRADTLTRSKQIPFWQAAELMTVKLFPWQEKKMSESAAGEISHPIWLSKHSWQPQGRRSLNNRGKQHMKILYFFWLEKNKVYHQKTLATAINWHFLTLALLTAFLLPSLPFLP